MITDNENKSSETDMKFIGNDPGAVRYGNFINYYQFHAPENRLHLLPEGIWENLLDKRICALDIGCNVGDLTYLLYESLRKVRDLTCSILGVDIDATLIARAIENNKCKDNITYECIDFVKDIHKDVILKNYLQQFDKTVFDVVFCFSITMWIHLNNGDEGLKLFLQEGCKRTLMLIIEPQPWKCYRTAERRMKKAKDGFPLFNVLKIRANVETEIENVLIECNFVKIVETDRTQWGRKILVFKRL